MKVALGRHTATGACRMTPQTLPRDSNQHQQDSRGQGCCRQRGLSAILVTPALLAAGRRHRRYARVRSCTASSQVVRKVLGYSQLDDGAEEEAVPETMFLDFGPETETRLEKIKEFTRTPVTLITGFLGAGKTSLLKHLLENQEGVRLGVVVNDVAAVNIDSQLIQKFESEGSIDMAELSNGCVCCTAADDLVASVQDLVMRKGGAKPFHHIIIELSGVGEPEAVKRHWDIGVEVGMPATLMTEVACAVAVVDASLFGQDWLDSRKVALRNEEWQLNQHVGFETVGQLLAEQVEKAEVVVLNKVDLASEKELLATREVVQALNPACRQIETSFGRVSPLDVLPTVPDAIRYPAAGAGRNYRWAQNEEEVEIEVAMPIDVTAKDINFRIGRTWIEVVVAGEERPRLQGRLFGRLKSIDEWLWELEGGEGSDGRCLKIYLEKSQSGMWEDLWEPAPSQASSSSLVSEQEEEEVRLESVAPETMLQSKEQANARLSALPSQLLGGPSAQSRFGIRSFVYQRDRPFAAVRLDALMEQWPLGSAAVAMGLTSRPQRVSEDDEKEALLEALVPVLRSKGFCWLDSEPLRRHEWAHAGRSLTVQADTWWWSVLEEDQLEFQLTYPGARALYEYDRAERWQPEWGDRRQELVFIGGASMSESEISALLDACLLTDEELEEFRSKMQDLSPPPEHFGIEGLLARLRGSQLSADGDS